MENLRRLFTPENDRWTDEANAIYREINSLVEPVVVRLANEGVSMRDLTVVLTSVVNGAIGAGLNITRRRSCNRL